MYYQKALLFMARTWIIHYKLAVSIAPWCYHELEVHMNLFMLRYYMEYTFLFGEKRALMPSIFLKGNLSQVVNELKVTINEGLEK